MKGRKKSYKVKNVRLSNHLSGNKLIIYSMVFCTIILINLKKWRNEWSWMLFGEKKDEGKGN
jgi:hypothetical protein